MSMGLDSRGRCWLLLSTLATAVAGVHGAEEPARLEPPPTASKELEALERVVRVELLLVNSTEEPQTVQSRLAIPLTNERQELLYVRTESGAPRLQIDDFGNRLLAYPDETLQAGEIRRRGYMAAVRTRAADYTKLSAGDALTSKERAAYTADASVYQIGDPRIQTLRDSLLRDTMLDRDKAEAVFRHLIANIRYFRDGQWDPAPDVLERGTGSCSEYNYAFISLLRASGVPCRYTGAFILSPRNLTRYDPRVHEDTVYHRWTEILLEGAGWFPADASRGSSAFHKGGDVSAFWGKVPAESLQTYRGDGGDSLPLAWDYVYNVRTLTTGRVRTMVVCYWIDAPLDTLPATLNEVSDALREKPSDEKLAKLIADPLRRETALFLLGTRGPAEYGSLGRALLEVHHPTAVYIAALAEYLGRPPEESPAMDAIADQDLAATIRSHKTKGAWDWGAFEYWWRKARPVTVFDEERGVFVLGEKDLYLH